jgi:GT2 family glycosyltransferase
MARLVPAARRFVARRRRLAAVIEHLMYRFPYVEDAVTNLVRGDPRERYQAWIAAYDSIDESDIRLMAGELAAFPTAPRLSLIIPTVEPKDGLSAALERSLSEQVFAQWDVEVVGNSCGEWLAALRRATADFVVVVDPSAVLRRHSLLLIARKLRTASDALLVYGDEDEIDGQGGRFGHDFKPDWNPALLRSQDYLGPVVCFRRDEALSAGEFEEDDNDPRWGLFLRLTEHAPASRIHHLPHVLSHRARHEQRVDPDRRAHVARELATRLSRDGLVVDLEAVGQASYRLHHRLPESPPLVSIIVPTTCRLDVLRPCVDSVLGRTSYPNFELLVVVNRDSALTSEQRDFLNGLERRSQVQVLTNEQRPYNFAKTNNWAVEQAKGETLCFLNDDTEVIATDWLSALVTEVLQERVAAAGAMLLYPNGRIQHAGVILGVGGVAAHAYRGAPRGTAGYHERALVAQDVSCVTAACMLVRREAFAQIDGFDPIFATAFNDVDLSLRLRQAGWRIVWTPAAELYHKESTSIGRHHTGERAEQWAVDYDLIRERWKKELLADPSYNQNLSLDGLEVWEPAFPPRVTYPWRRLDGVRPW